MFTTRSHSKALCAILGTLAIYGLSMGLLRPLLALILEGRGVDSTLIGLNAIMPAIGMLVSAPFIPFLIKTLGMRRFLFACLVIDIAMLLQYPRYDHLYAWFVIGIVSGAVTNSLLVTSETWINEILDDSNRGRFMGMYNALLAATIACGPLVIPVTGTSGWAPFITGACIIALAALPLVWSDIDYRLSSGSSSFSILTFLLVAPVLVFAVLLFSWKETAVASLLPVYGIKSGLTEAEAAIMLTALGAGGVCLSYPAGWLADRFDRFMVLVLCGTGVLTGALLLPLVITDRQLLLMLLFFWGGMFAGIYTIVLTIVGQHFRGMELVVANIAIGILWGVGSLTGPAITGFTMDVRGPDGFPLVFIVASALFIVFASARRFMAKTQPGPVL